MTEINTKTDADIKKTKVRRLDTIHIKGARSNNLKDIEIHLPKNKLIVVTGLSGSGKSSLIMDTLFAEGQRRYVESLSSYARQFLNRMKKPEVDFIKGICPAIAIEQKVSTSNARSTVGSLTEIYDYLRLLYARIGKTISPVSGNAVKKHTVADVVNFIMSKEFKTKIVIYSPLPKKYGDRTLRQELNLLLQKGYTRILFAEELYEIQEFLETDVKEHNTILRDLKVPVYLLIDRFLVTEEEENRKRIADSVLTAFNESEGECLVDAKGTENAMFNNRFELDGIEFVEPRHELFNYNNPFGACKSCGGYGRILGIDPKKVIPNSSLSIFEGAIACWRGEKYGRWKNLLIESADRFDFPIHRPVKKLTEVEYKLLWTGNHYFHGIDDFFTELEEKTYKIQNRVMLARYRGRTACTDCGGGRLRKEASYVKIDGYNIMDLTLLPVDELLVFFDKMKISEHDKKVAKRILLEITSRLTVMVDVGLGYLSLDRLSSSLSGGETQRINLTRTLGSNLTSSLYILDEPSIGLHPKDTAKLVEVLFKLRDLGNTVIVVEHEEEVIKNADYIIDMGPGAGIHGGEIVFAGDYNNLDMASENSLTADYMLERKQIEIPERRRKVVNKIHILGANQHNLKDIDVCIPLNCMNVISGVSGSGKTSFVKYILYPALKREIGEPIARSIGEFEAITGDLSQITGVELINQSPIGRSSRSNPITYVKAYDGIRKLMADQQLSKIRGFKAKHFSFNVEGGRCDNCNGDGEITVEMQFLADVKLICEDCNGMRFKQEVLDVKHNGKNIYDILGLSIEEALDFFQDHKEITNKIQSLYDVGLGYIKLGQSSSTLSGGEAQRVKLASFLAKRKSSEHIFFIFDEPTTGLHFHDVQKLLDAFSALVENGHTVLVVEHNMEVIKCADWIIDLGPVGGKYGGHLVYQGVPEDITDIEGSFTGKYLQAKFAVRDSS